ncbi:MAG TPA: hypothetical protein VK553_04100 [Candidatus Nitrosopolaris rasttigaisensis]|nr:hypothetical protein [Candidatus Nitrosopolaris rasttigaisensis]
MADSAVIWYFSVFCSAASHNLVLILKLFEYSEAQNRKICRNLIKITKNRQNGKYENGIQYNSPRHKLGRNDIDPSLVCGAGHSKGPSQESKGIN